MVLPHPLARERAAEAVPDDVDALRAGVARAPRARSARRSGTFATVECATAERLRLVGEQVALVALVAERPQLGRRVAVSRAAASASACTSPKRVARGRVGRVVVAVEEDHRRPLHRPGRAEAEHRRPERGVQDRRESRPGRSCRTAAEAGRRGRTQRRERRAASIMRSLLVGEEPEHELGDARRASPQPSRSTVAASVTWRPARDLARRASTRNRARIRLPDGTGDGKRTRLSP